MASLGKTFLVGGAGAIKLYSSQLKLAAEAGAGLNLEIAFRISNLKILGPNSWLNFNYQRYWHKQ